MKDYEENFFCFSSASIYQQRVFLVEEFKCLRKISGFQVSWEDMKDSDLQKQ